MKQNKKLKGQPKRGTIMHQVQRKRQGERRYCTIHTIYGIYIYIPTVHFFMRKRPFLFRPRVFPRSLGLRARHFEPRPGSVAHALGVQSPPRQSRAGQWKPHNLTFLFFAQSLLLLYLVCRTHRPSAVAHQALSFVTATDGASLCVSCSLPTSH